MLHIISTTFSVDLHAFVYHYNKFAPLYAIPKGHLNAAKWRHVTRWSEIYIIVHISSLFISVIKTRIDK